MKATGFSHFLKTLVGAEMLHHYSALYGASESAGQDRCAKSNIMRVTPHLEI